MSLGCLETSSGNQNIRLDDGNLEFAGKFIRYLKSNVENVLVIAKRWDTRIRTLCYLCPVPIQQESNITMPFLRNQITPGIPVNC